MPDAIQEAGTPLDTFLAILALSPASLLEPFENDLEGAYTHLNLSGDNVLSTFHLYEHLAQGIKDVIGHTAQPPRVEDLTSLRDELLARHVLDGLPLQPAFRILDHLIDATVDGRKPFTDDANWRAAIQLAKDCIVFDYDRDAQTDFAAKRRFTRQVRVAEAARRLRAHGVCIKIRDARVVVEDDDLRKVSEEIFSRVKRTGDLCIARAVFPRLAFNERQGRYVLVEDASSRTENKSPSVPTGYLLHLAVRAISEGFLEPEDGMMVNKLWQEICAIGADLIAVYDVQRYSMFESMFHDATSLIPFIRRLAIRESAFSLQQLRPSDLCRLLRGLFDWVDEKEHRRQTGFRMSDAISVAERAIAIASKVRGPCILRESKLADAIPNATKRDIRALFRCYTHEDGAANRGYLLPTDIHLQTIGDRPFLPFAPGKVLILDASWAASSFFNALLRNLQGAMGEQVVNGKIGHALERLVHKSLQEKGIAPASGKYQASAGEHGECDAVVEASDALIFIETKLRVLSASSRAGGDASLLIDLSRSLIRAQVQLGNHETRIRRDQHLSLTTDDQRRTTVSLKPSQSIERIALTTLDYGTLQDPLILHQLLLATTSATFKSPDPGIQKKLDELHDRGRDLERQHLELKTLDPSKEHQPFFHCWFLSLPQLFVLLDTATDADSLWKRLRTARHITTGRLDFYADLAFADQIKAPQAQM